MPDASPHPPAEATSAPPASPPPPPPDLTGRTLGDYQVLRRLGVGGMGQVYLARQLSLKREVALKLLRTDQAANSTALLRFQAEAEAVAKLNHPNIVHIHHLGEFEGQRYMVLEYVEGRNLRDHLARRGPPDLPVTLSIIRQVVIALQKAHDEGIVHRDIKPENILVTRKVEVKVTDFGLSRFFAGETQALNLTQSGITLGTPLYMSPEQVQGKPVDHRSDIYSLGVTCYHLFDGRAALSRRNRVRRGSQARPGTAASARGVAARPSRRPVRDGPQDDGQEPGGALPIGAGNRSRPGEDPRRSRGRTVPVEWSPLAVAAGGALAFEYEHQRCARGERGKPRVPPAGPMGELDDRRTCGRCCARSRGAAARGDEPAAQPSYPPPRRQRRDCRTSDRRRNW